MQGALDVSRLPPRVQRECEAAGKAAVDAFLAVPENEEWFNGVCHGAHDRWFPLLALCVGVQGVIYQRDLTELAFVRDFITYMVRHHFVRSA
jgi:hypothetical protein